MKKTISLILVLMLSMMIFSGCSKKNNVIEESTEENWGVVEDTTEAETTKDNVSNQIKENENSNPFQIIDIAYESFERQEYGKDDFLRFTTFTKKDLGESAFSTFIPVNLPEGQILNILHESLYFIAKDEETGEYIYETMIEEKSYLKAGDTSSVRPFSAIVVTPIFDTAKALEINKDVVIYLPENEPQENVVALASLDDNMSPEIVVYESVTDVSLEWKFYLFNTDTKSWDLFKTNKIDL